MKYGNWGIWVILFYFNKWQIFVQWMYTMFGLLVNILQSLFNKRRPVLPWAMELPPSSQGSERAMIVSVGVPVSPWNKIVKSKGSRSHGAHFWEALLNNQTFFFLKGLEIQTSSIYRIFHPGDIPWVWIMASPVGLKGHKEGRDLQHSIKKAQNDRGFKFPILGGI